MSPHSQPLAAQPGLVPSTPESAPAFWDLGGSQRQDWWVQKNPPKQTTKPTKKKSKKVSLFLEAPCGETVMAIPAEQPAFFSPAGCSVEKTTCSSTPDAAPSHSQVPAHQAATPSTPSSCVMSVLSSTRHHLELHVVPQTHSHLFKLAGGVIIWKA